MPDTSPNRPNRIRLLLKSVRMAADVSVDRMAELMAVDRDVAVRVELPEDVDVPVRDVLKYIAVLLEIAPALTRQMLRIDTLQDAARGGITPMNSFAFQFSPCHVLILAILERNDRSGRDHMQPIQLLKEIVEWLSYPDGVAEVFHTTTGSPGYGMADMVKHSLERFALADQSLREFREACADLAHLGLTIVHEYGTSITRVGISVVGNMAIASRATYKELLG